MPSIVKPVATHPSLQRNDLGLTIRDYEGTMSTLCAECGHDSITAAITRAFWEVATPPHMVAKLSGIGCSSKTPAYFVNGAHGLNSAHGRMPPIATGANAANRDLMCIGISGDGDSLSIGLGHMCHAIRRNVRMVYVIENNGVYGLTKGQFSASADVGSKSKRGDPNRMAPIDSVMLGLSIGATFIARSFSGDKDQLVPILKAAISHRGFALIDVISPCVTFNDHEGSTKSYLYTRQHELKATEADFVPPASEILAQIGQNGAVNVTMHDGSMVRFKGVPPNYDPTDRGKVMDYLEEHHGKGEVVTGLLYLDESVPDMHEMNKTTNTALTKVPYQKLCPGAAALDRLQEDFRDPFHLMITETQTVQFDSIELDCGSTLAPVDVAYETYGELNARKSNAILVLHAFTGDAHAAGTDKITGATGWWDSMIGPGKGLDTDKYFVICSNILGGCRGSSGPGSINPETGCPYAMSFPPVTIPDMVRLQNMLVGHLGIERLLAVAGGSMGAMQALQWAVAYPDAVAASIPIAGTARHSPQQIAFNEVGRQAIMADLDWNEGDYYGKRPPARGLAVARMVGHITYMSDASMREKFGRRLRDQDQFEVESYLRYRGSQFVDRFDANSYLYITKAMDYFDLTAGRPSLSAAFDGVKSRFLVISFSSDWLYPSYQSLDVVRALRGRNCDVAYCDLPSTYGHDAFLVNVAEQTELVRGFLASTFREKS